MFYAAWGWVLPNWKCSCLPLNSFSLLPSFYPGKLSRVVKCVQRFTMGNLVDRSTTASKVNQTEPLQLHFITQTWAFLFTNLGNLIDIYLFSLPDLILLCSSFTAEAPPQLNISFSTFPRPLFTSPWRISRESWTFPTKFEMLYQTKTV